MRTKYKYINFVKIEDKPKTSVWSCRSADECEIGIIKWYPAWRQYSYFPRADSVYSAGCLKDICDFIQQLKGN